MPNERKSRISNFIRPRSLAALAGAFAVAGGAATALAADPKPQPATPEAAGEALFVDQREQAEYMRVYQQAKRLDIEPKRNLAQVAPASSDLDDRAGVLRIHVVAERGKRKLKDAAKPDFGTPESVGVDQGTLDSIAACESGGNPAAVDASGTYYGKYQFDFGTWASVGGSGSPAAASAAEQDYRAALLYSRAGSSPWPVCG